MGRKGVSKRKPNQTKAQPFSNNKAGGSVSSVMQAVETQPLKTLDTGKTTQTADRKKPTKKG